MGRFDQNPAAIKNVPVRHPDHRLRQRYGNRMAEPALLRTFGERTGINPETNFNTDRWGAEANTSPL